MEKEGEMEEVGDKYRLVRGGMARGHLLDTYLSSRTSYFAWLYVKPFIQCTFEWVG